MSAGLTKLESIVVLLLLQYAAHHQAVELQVCSVSLQEQGSTELAGCTAR